VEVERALTPAERAARRQATLEDHARQAIRRLLYCERQRVDNTMFLAEFLKTAKALFAAHDSNAQLTVDNVILGNLSVPASTAHPHFNVQLIANYIPHTEEEEADPRRRAVVTFHRDTVLSYKQSPGQGVEKLLRRLVMPVVAQVERYVARPSMKEQDRAAREELARSALSMTAEEREHKKRADAKAEKSAREARLLAQQARATALEEMYFPPPPPPPGGASGGAGL